ncbi:peptidoglycan DD-metalloendopeptidase family protein [Patescibacteria group bacterium]|nr:peptidoglycan DD-metalloendopeptidase family protein [Patescibacteria group bacterium]
MLQTKIKTINIIYFGLAIFLAGVIFFPKNNTLAVEYTLDNLESVETWQINQDINEKRSEIQELKRQVEIYEKNIAAKQREIGSLSNQISTLNDSIAKINLEIDAAELEIETYNLKIENTELKIQAKENEINEQKEVLSEILRQLHRQQQKNSTIEILVLNNSFSDFLADLDRLENMQDNIVSGVEDLKKIMIALDTDKQNLEGEKSELDALRGILENKIGSLDDQKVAKNQLMIATRGQESKYQQLLQQAKEDQDQVNNDIVYLEKVAREKLNRQLQLEGISSDGLMWPVASRRVTSYFHDPDYPYRNLFEHPAIDIASPQGTPIRAVESGYVAKTRDGGKTGYSYIMLVHGNGLSSVYGHINIISCTEDQFVSKGDIIGYSGGMPGTNGSGPLTTGPHLHLEIRLNGVPVNPLNYLP